MTDATMPAVQPPAEPDGAARVAVLDILRGIAILGILFMNINDMGGSIHVLFGGDFRHFGWGVADQIVWWLREVLANGTARCLLEMLFGVGMVILTDRGAASLGKWQVLRAYWWRNIVLFLFGLAHVWILLWPGDILHTYGLAALVAVLFRNFRVRWLLIIGLSLAMLQLVGAGIGVEMANRQHAGLAAVAAKQAAGQPITTAESNTLVEYNKSATAGAKRRAETAARVAAEDKTRTGDGRSWAQAAWDAWLFIQVRGLELLFVWEAAGTMLIGAALYKLGIIQGARSRRFYANLVIVAYAIGLGFRVWGTWGMTRFDHLIRFPDAAQEVSRLATTLGHVALVNWLVLTVVGARLLRPFEAAGKTALSVYIAQTLICLWVLYPPWGLALYGDQSWWQFMVTALAINAVLLIGANWWVRYYAIAPVEWAWRSIVAGKRLPFRPLERSTSAVAEA
ncbi:DUF418 domain-containing protein [Sphingomonas sp.]|uniref:DUF418 domain-containing protein n=1 Tax=Sphingomonas sp. TaxID=28214 RepID=UPI002D7F1DE2|nr:DUF418 domain-containing protein [Sphingomonas sp.]HEU0043533.1 DUF418 domain-containing protein [Sphingomonas sp.]